MCMCTCMYVCALLAHSSLCSIGKRGSLGFLTKHYVMPCYGGVCGCEEECSGMWVTGGWGTGRGEWGDLQRL